MSVHTEEELEEDWLDKNRIERESRRYTYQVDPLELEHCFTCPLFECVGRLSLRCPINQELARLSALDGRK